MADEKLKEIRAEFVSCANKTLISQLLDKLLQEGVLNEEEADEVKENMKKQDQARILIDHVRRKGPRASQIFIHALQCQDSFLAEELRLQVPPPEQQARLPLQEVGPRAVPSAKAPQLQETSDGLTLCPLDLFQKIQAEEKDEIYPIKDKETRTRLALVICNIVFEHCSKRDGAEVDLAEMKILLEGLGYRVETETNLCSQDMARRLKSFAAQEEHKTSDSTFVVLMSHGLREGLCGVKHEDSCRDLLSVDTVFSTFNNKNCPALRGKPKVIVIQACRGENKGFAYVSDSATPSAAPLSPVQWPEEDFESDAIHKVHVESDFICLYSTTPDNVSWRSPKTGSLFITQLIKDIKEHAWNCNLEEIFRKVMQSFEKNPRQMPSKDRTTLTKKLYLFPGH
ncbi:caspase-4 isoform X2 [Zootoca vivipara]|uniref:caspase-4 isoform X2 n=1 Tax=Zootoca vivipara TaxID=8524 RepID=UPI00293C0391|nr:caspase-4 isoform X2 [Zootoca vivipara]